MASRQACGLSHPAILKDSDLCRRPFFRLNLFLQTSLQKTIHVFSALSPLTSANGIIIGNITVAAATVEFHEFQNDVQSSRVYKAILNEFPVRNLENHKIPLCTRDSIEQRFWLSEILLWRPLELNFRIPETVFNRVAYTKRNDMKHKDTNIMEIRK